MAVGLVELREIVQGARREGAEYQLIYAAPDVLGFIVSESTSRSSHVPKVHGAGPFKGRMCLVDSGADAGAASYPADRHRKAVGAAPEAISV